MSRSESAIRVAVPAPLYGEFDYLSGDTGPAPAAGARVRVPFGRRRAIGVVTATDVVSDVDASRLRRIEAVLDAGPVLPEATRRLCRWAAVYYHHPPGEVYAAALPVLLRRGAAAERTAETWWRLTADGVRMAGARVGRAPRQRQVLWLLAGRSRGCAEAELREWVPRLPDALRRLWDKGLIEAFEPGGGAEPAPGGGAPSLNDAQAKAVAEIEPDRGRFTATLLQGVTGSGKTEVYLALAERALAAGEQVLVLVPEIGLTPQLVARFRERLARPVVLLHSELGDRERLNAWLDARDGRAGVVLGTRSAVFTPLARPGLIIVDEEHDPSFKQQDGLRYSGRDMAVRRAQMEDVPVVLGSATPALETLRNAISGRYRHCRLPRRIGGARPPAIGLLDVRSRPLTEGLSEPLITRLRAHVEAGGQALLFLNRRGYAPALVCHDCGWVAPCRRCDVGMTLHTAGRRLHCHHCGAQRPPPPRCEECGGETLVAAGEGTQRIEAALRSLVPGVPVARFDRDSTARKGALTDLLARVRDGRVRVLVGTQMIAKGHDFPDLSFVGVVNADHGLFSADYRALERMAQLVTQVAGRAGRGERAGEVLLQTRHPEHPLLDVLVRRGYDAFAELALEERRAAGFPPFGRLALLQAESPHLEAPMAFLEAAGDLAQSLGAPGVELLGPAPAPMARRAGRHRAQLLLRADERRPLHRLLRAWVPRLAELKAARKARWSVDVDPQDLI